MTNIPILFEDSEALVIDKPAGLVVHPAAGNPTRLTTNIKASTQVPTPKETNAAHSG